ncbi:MAG: hypothetical protein IT462_02875 [Planctomycetes bacterium]|nr:hypothetical protein [Planctomycetota bacterium]
MRTLIAISLAATVAFGVAATVSAEEKPKPLTRREQTELATKVYNLLKDKCYGCHGETGKTVYGLEGKFDYILDYDKLVEARAIRRSFPGESKIWMQINDGEMPRKLDSNGEPKTKVKLALAEIDLVKKWVDAGVPRWPGAKPWGKPLKWEDQLNERQYFDGQYSAVAEARNGALVCLACGFSGEDMKTYVWDGTAWVETKTETLPPEDAIWGSGVFDEKRDQTVFFSRGKSGNTVTWDWDGKVWSNQELPSVPKYRSEPATVFHPVRKTVLMFGGAIPLAGGEDVVLEDGKKYTHRGTNELWEYDGSTWTQLKLKDPPPVRYHYEMVYDRVAKQILLFECHALTSSVWVEPQPEGNAPVWVMEADQWRKITPEEGLPRNQGYTAAWYEPLKCVITCGWDRVSGNQHRDSMPAYAWDGANWRQLQLDWPAQTPQGWPSSPPGKPRLLWDGVNKHVVLAGGEEVGNMLNTSLWALVFDE